MNFVSNIIAFNQQVLNIQALGQLTALAPNVAQISIESIIEEIDEFRQATAAGDLIKSVDALADTLYFTVGVMYKLGMTEEQIIGSIADHHYSQVDCVVSTIWKDSELEVLPTFQILPQDMVEDVCKTMEEIVADFSLFCDDGDIAGSIVSMGHIARGAIIAMSGFGLSTDSTIKVMDAVHCANMEKKLGVNAKRGDGKTADAVKPEGWIPPEERIGEILDRQSQLKAS